MEYDGKSRFKLLTLNLVIVAVVVFLAGCSNSNQTGTTTPTNKPQRLYTTINGEVPPGKVSSLTNSQELVNKIVRNNEIRVLKGTRLPGTRAPIHVHEDGGTTCVLQGQMTLYMQGAKPMTALAGSCYWMPPHVIMTGFNSGTADAVIFDMFTTPANAPVWEVVEKGQQNVQNEGFDGGG
jgi:quercetin dioxygenase-like cupin family protein